MDSIAPEINTMSLVNEDKDSLVFEWVKPEDVTDRFIQDVVALLNQVALKERNMGFNEPIKATEQIAKLKQTLINELLGGGHIFSIKLNEQVIGTVTMIPCGLPARKHVAEVKRCVIATEFRGRNLMLEGWKHLLARCKKSGICNLVIDVRTDYSKTLELWKKLGFIEFGRLTDYARMDGKSIDGVFLHYPIL